MTGTNWAAKKAAESVADKAGHWVAEWAAVKVAMLVSGSAAM